MFGGHGRRHHGHHGHSPGHSPDHSPGHGPGGGPPHHWGKHRHRGQWGPPPPHWGPPGPQWGQPGPQWGQPGPQWGSPPYPGQFPPGHQDWMPATDPGPADGGIPGWTEPQPSAPEPLPANPEKEGFVGRVLVLYHSTTESQGLSIASDNLLLPNTHGLAGAAIYFSPTRETAAQKSNGALVVAQVTVGTAYVLRTARELSLVEVVRLGCDSVKVVGVGKDEEYAIYDPRQVRIGEIWLGSRRLK